MGNFEDGPRPYIIGNTVYSGVRRWALMAAFVFLKKKNDLIATVMDQNTVYGPIPHYKGGKGNIHLGGEEHR